VTTPGHYHQRFVDSTAAQAYAGRFEKGSRRRTHLREQRAVAGIFARLPECASVLDVPCGAGRFLETLSQNHRTVTEMDVSAAMVDLARERARQITPPPQFLVGDAGDIKLATNAVDSVFCNRLLHHLRAAEERIRVLKEFHRITRQYLVVSFFDYHSFGWARRLVKAFKGRKTDYRAQPTLPAFLAELELCGFQLLQIVPIGPFWVSEKYLLLKKADPSPGSPRSPG